MKFVYRYRTKDNVEHCGEVFAANREFAYQAIRAQGIKPGQLRAADGFFNKAFGLWKRWIAIGILSLLACALIVLWLRSEGKVQEVMQRGVVSPRHQIYGDPEIMARFDRLGFEDCLPRVGDRILAQFAQPGKFVAARGVVAECLDRDLAMIADVNLPISDGDSREIRELKQIVNGMRCEMREYMSDGCGSYRSYFQRLVERYLAEKKIRDRVAAELERSKDENVWTKKNEQLRRMGLEVVVRGED